MRTRRPLAPGMRSGFITGSQGYHSAGRQKLSPPGLGILNPILSAGWVSSLGHPRAVPTHGCCCRVQKWQRSVDSARSVVLGPPRTLRIVDHRASALGRPTSPLRADHTSGRHAAPLSAVRFGLPAVALDETAGPLAKTPLSRDALLACVWQSVAVAGVHHLRRLGGSRNGACRTDIRLFAGASHRKLQNHKRSAFQVPFVLIGVPLKIRI